MPPELIFGTASFGMDQTDFQGPSSIVPLLEELRRQGITRLDSGARYPPGKPGLAEKLAGEVLPEREFVVDTKVYTDVTNDGSGDLAAEAVERSVVGSLARLMRPQVNVLHIHRSDPTTPLEEQVRAFAEQIYKGRCKAWGLSNVSPEILEDMLRICDEKGLPKPVCYQGDYNMVTRGMEKKLLPLLRKHGMAFNAFRPLAAGFLTAKLVRNEHEGTRLGNSHPIGAVLASKVFGAEDLHAAMRTFDEAVRVHGLTPLEVAVRWIAHHSALRDEDGVVLGASKVGQVVETVGMIKKGPLSGDVVELAEKLWRDVKGSRGDIL